MTQSMATPDTLGQLLRAAQRRFDEHPLKDMFDKARAHRCEHQLSVILGFFSRIKAELEGVLSNEAGSVSLLVIRFDPHATRVRTSKGQALREILHVSQWPFFQKRPISDPDNFYHPVWIAFTEWAAAQELSVQLVLAPQEKGVGRHYQLVVTPKLATPDCSTIHPHDYGREVLVHGNEGVIVPAPAGERTHFGAWVYLPSKGYASDYALHNIKPA